MQRLRRNRRLLSGFMTVLTVFWQVWQPLQAATNNWTAGSNTDFLWSTASNWSGVAPVASDDVIFGTPVPNPGALLNPSIIGLGAGSVANSLSFKGSYSLTGGDLTLTAGNVRVDLGQQLTLGSQLFGGAGLTKSGGGTLRLTNATNSYTGATTINDGIVSISDQAALGADTSAIVVNGSATRSFGGGALLLEGGVNMTRTVSLQGVGPVPTAGSALISVGNNTISTLNNGTGLVNTAVSSAGGRLTMTDVAITGANTLTLGATNTVGSGSYAITGNLSGAGILGKTGAGTLQLTPASSSGFSGIVQTSAGSIRVSTDAALGTSTAANAVDLNGGIMEFRSDAPNFNTRKVNLNNGGTLDLYADRAVGGSAINQTLTLANFDYDVSETLTFNSRNGYNVTFTAATAIGSGAGDTAVTYNGNGLATFGGTLWGNTNGTARTLTISGTGNTLLTGNVTASGANHVLVKSGTGTVTLQGTAGTYLGATTTSGGALVITDFRTVNGHSTGTNTSNINIGSSTTAGILTIGTATAATAAGLTLLSGKSINLSGTTGGATINANQSFAAPVIIGSVLATGAGAKSLTLGGTSTQDNIINGAIPDSTSATSLVKTDGGTWVLAGNNTYTGSTTISGGILKLKASASSTLVSDSSAIIFNSNATTLSGGGTIDFVGANNLASTETVGALTATAGAGTVKTTATGSGSAALTFSALGTRTAGATINYTPGLSSTINFTTAPVVTNGIIAAASGGAAFQTYSGVNWATLTGSTVSQYGGYTTTAIPASGTGSAAVNFSQNANASTTGTASINTLKIVGGVTNPTITLGGILTLTAKGVLFDNSSGTGTITGSQLGANAVETVIITNGTTAANALTVNSLIGGTTGSLTKSGTGTLIIGGANTYTGNTIINEGIVRLSGAAATLGVISTPGNVTTLRQSATLDINAAGPSNTVTIGGLNGAGTITNGGGGTATAGTLAIGSGTSTAGGTFSGLIQDGAGVMNVAKNGTGTQVLSGLNSYTGSTTISSTGLISAPTLANIGSNSSIGKGLVTNDTTNAASLVFTGTTGGLNYTGTTSVSVDRLFTLNSSTAGGGGQIANSSGNNSTVIFNKTSPIAFGAAASGVPQTFTLGGASSGDNQINLQFIDNGATRTSLSKIGAGVWFLGNSANSYTGTTTVTAGVLGITSGAALPANSPLVLAGGQLLTSGTFDRNIVATATAGNANEVNWTAGGGFAANEAKLIVAIGGTASPTALTWGSGGFVTTGNNLILSSSTALSEVEWRNPIDINAAIRTIQVDDNPNTFADFATITGVISGNGGLTKTGSGTLNLFAANTYTGNTAVISASTLTVNSLGNSATPGVGTSVGLSTGANLAANAITLGNAGTTAGILQYVGPGETSDRMIRLNTSTGSTQIHADGRGPLVLTNVLNDLTAGNKTLFLRGSNTQGNMITSVLADNVAGTNTLGITVDSGATWILTNANTYSGVTETTGGALGAGNDAAFGTGTLRVRNGSLFAHGADRTLTNPLADTSTTTAIVSSFIGEYSLNLTSNWTHSNTTAGQTISNGIAQGKTLTLGGDLIFNSLSGGVTVTFNGTGNTILNGSITTSTAQNVNLTYSGTGSLTIGGTAPAMNAGNVTVSSGTLRLGNNEVIQNGAGAGNLTLSPAVGVTATLDLNGKSETVNALTGTAAGTMIIDNSSGSAASLTVGDNNQAATFNGSITRSGTGALTLGKTGTATATFTGPLDITAIDVQGGALKLNNPLGMSTTVAGAMSSVTVAAGGLLNLYDGFGAPMTSLTSLSLGGGALAGTATTVLELEAGGTGGIGVTSGIDALVTSNPAVVNAATLAGQIVLNVRDAGLSPSTSYTLISAPSGLLNGGAINYYALGALGGYAGSTITQTDTAVILNVGTAVLGNMFWTGGTDTKWNTIDGSFNGLNWSSTQDGLTLSTTVPGAGTTVVFQADSAPAGVLNTTLEQSFRINNLVVQPSTTPLTSLAIAPGAVATNRLTISPSAPADGIELKTGAPLGVTISSQLAAGANQTWKVADFSTAPVTGGGTTISTNNVVVGSTTGLVAGMQISGPGIPTGAYITQVVDGTNITISANATQTGSGQTYTVTSSLNLTGGLFGTGSITKSGPGRVVLSGAGNTFTGTAVSITGGILETQNVTALGGIAATPNTGATITVGPGAEFRHNNATAGTIANPLVLNGGTLSSGGFTTAATTLALTAINHTYSGNVSVTADSTLNFADLGTSTTLGHAFTMSGVISGTGKLIADSVPTVSAGNQISGSVSITNNGNTGWSGGLLMKRGTVVSTAANGLGTGAITFNPFGRVIIRGTDGNTYNFGGALNFASGAVGEFQVDNTGALASNLTVNQNAPVNLGNGTGSVIARFNMADVASNLNLTGGVVLNDNASFTAIGGDADSLVTISGIGISETGGSRSLAINDEAGVWAVTSTRLAINVASTYTGGTTLNEGTLILGHKDALGTGGFTVTGASTLQGGVDLSGTNALPYLTTLSAGLTVSGTNNITFANTVTQNGGDRTLTNNLTSPAALLLTTLRLAEAASATARNLTIAGSGATTISALVNNDQSNTLTNNLTPATLTIGTIALSDTAAAGRTLTLGGTGNTIVTGLIENIAGGGGLAGSLNKTGTGILTLQAANTFTGDVTATAGSIEFSTVSNVGGAASNLGQGTNLNLAGGTLNFVGSASQSTNRPMPLTASSTLAANGTSGATITYNGAIAGASTTLTLDGAGTGILNSVLTQTGTAADLNKNGSGTWTINTTNMIADDINVNVGVLNINAPQNFGNTATTASNHVVVTGTTAVVNLNAANSHLGDDLFIRSGATVNLGINGALTRESVARGTDGMRNLIIADTGTTDTSKLDLQGFTAATGTVTIGTDTIAGQIVDSVGGGNLNATGYTVRLGNVSASLAGTATFAKNGIGTFTLSGNNTYTGATTITEGNLVLDYGTNTGSKISTTAGVVIGGSVNETNPTLTINGNGSGPMTQSFTTLTVNQGSNNIVVNSASGQAANVNFTTLVRGAGGTVDITLPSVGAVTSTQSLINGLIAGYATINNGAAFASKDGSNNLVAATLAAKDSVATWLSTDNVSDVTGFTGTIPDCTTVNSITFNAAGSMVSNGDLLGITTGGILVTSTATSAGITGGVLTSAANDLIVHQYATGDFTMGSTIRGINGITKTGTGSLLLSSSNNSFTGSLIVTEGLVKVSGGNAIGDNAPVTLKEVPGVSLQLLANEAIGNLTGGGATGGSVAIGSNTLTLNTSANSVFSGFITGNGTIVKQGTANMNFNTVSLTGFNGTAVINQGLLFVSGDGIANLPAVTSITANTGGAFLIDFNSATVSSNRVNDLAQINLSSQGNGSFVGLHLRGSGDLSITETVGPVILNGSSSVIGVSQAGGTARTLNLTGASLVRQNNATVFIDGRNLAVTTGDNRGRVFFTAAPAVVGGAGVAGGTATNVPVIRHVVTLQNANAIAVADVPNTFANYNTTTGITPLNIATEYKLDAAGYAASVDANDNLRFTTSASALATQTFNAIVFDSSAGAMTVNGAGGGTNVLTVGSGAMLFTSTAAANGTTLGTYDAITPGANSSNEFIITTANTTATINSPLTNGAGATTLTKSGSGTLILGGSNTYTGQTVFNQGIVRASADVNLGVGGALNFFGGTLQFGGVFDPSTRAISFSAFGGGGTFDTNGNDIVLANAIGNASLGAFTKAGLGNLTVNAPVTYTGGTTVTNGTLTAGVANAFGSGRNLTVNGATATADLGAFNHTLGTLTVNGALTGSGILTAANLQLQSGTIASTITLAGSVGFTKTGTGTISLPGTSTFTGRSVIENGTVSVDALGNVGATASGLGAPTTVDLATIYLGAGTTTGTLNYTGSGAATNRNFYLVGGTGGGGISSSGTGALIIAGSVESEEFGVKTFSLGGTADPSIINRLDGALTECAGTVSLAKTGTSTWRLNAVNLYTGTSTAVDEGKLILGVANSIPTTTTLRVGNGTTAGTLDTNGFNTVFTGLLSQTNSTTATNSLVIQSGTTMTVNGVVTLGANVAASTTLITASGGGSFVNNNTGGTFQVGGATGGTNVNATIADFSGLSAFTANLGTAGTFRVGDNNTNSSGAPVGNSTVILASTTNTITAGTISLGQGTGQGTSVQTLSLGVGTNVLNADTINIGGNTTRSGGAINFAGSSGTAVFRAADGVGATVINMVNGGISTGFNQTSDLLLAGHSVDVLASTVTMATRSANTGSVTANLTFDDGALSITTLNIANRSGTGTATGSATGTVTLGDGALVGTPTTTIGTVNMAINTSAGGTVTADLNVAGGLVNLGSVNMTNATTGRTAIASINLTGGSTTLGGNITRTAGAGTETATITLNGSTAVLNMAGNSIGSSTASINLVASSGTLRNLGQLNGGGTLTKTTGGTLVMDGNNTYTGTTSIVAGILQVDNTTGSGTGTGSVTTDLGAMLRGTGSISPASGNNIVINGTLAPGDVGAIAGSDLALNLLGSSTLNLNGGLSFTLFGNNNTGTLNPLSKNTSLIVSAPNWSSILFGPSASLTVGLGTGVTTTGWMVGDAFQLFDWTGIGTGVPPGPGSLSAVNLPALDPGLDWDASGLFTSGRIVVMNVAPEPGRAMLLLIGLLGFCLRRRRHS